MAMPLLRIRMPVRAAQAALLACLLSACGYKGDLVLPPKDDAALTQPPAAPSATTPSPSSQPR